MVLFVSAASVIMDSDICVVFVNLYKIFFTTQLNMAVLFSHDGYKIKTSRHIIACK